MIDLSDPKGQIIAAALELAKTQPWSQISLLDIARAAKISLVDLRAQVSCKAAILTAFSRRVDDVVLLAPPRSEDGETARDRIFEVIMNRFDAMTPHKQALKSIAADGLPEPLQIRALASSQHWMLQAAGVSTQGAHGAIKVAGLMSVYGAVFRNWLQDDDEGLSRTMAILDRRLRRGESTLRRVEDVACEIKGAGRRLCKMAACGLPWNWRKAGSSSSGNDSGAAGDDAVASGAGADAGDTKSAGDNGASSDDANGATPAPAV